ncbi:16S rRNA (uracil(1498)-N(3))-methyltransferase [Longirhabdus pacifica]|uniref:16S rRNA (uracil(1498)-N(3))-methyltransferase n=1 Tax=Longirhabdus pacifica TaxID=2305227 RepID=UPI001008CE58|nr:16S rRNA (uracil(1498)-N(3))-methyltransferase [Longirhabdus pacifica]
MQRYFVPAEQFAANTVTIKDDDAHHIVKVMRQKIDDEIIVSNGNGHTVLAKISHIEGKEVTATIQYELEDKTEANVEVWVAQSLPKGDKCETIVQKCTELGADKIIPFQSVRTIVQYDQKKMHKRLERWRKIAKEAAEQAHRDVIPEVTEIYSWKQILSIASEADLAMICYEKEDAVGIKDALQRISLSAAVGESEKKKILIIIGPEGGFTEEEASQAEMEGCTSIHLGKRILRTETAGMVALSCIYYETGEMGGK